MSVVEHPTRTYRYMLTEGPIGNTAAATVFLGFLSQNTAPIHETCPGESGEHATNLSTPVEELIQDLFIHRDLAFAMNPTVYVYSQLPGGPQYPASGPDAGLLTVPTEVTDLGEGPPDLTTPEIPGYREMIELASQRVCCGLNDFHGYRYRLRYPPIPAMSVLRHRLLPQA